MQDLNLKSAMQLAWSLLLVLSLGACHREARVEGRPVAKWLQQLDSAAVPAERIQAATALGKCQEREQQPIVQALAKALQDHDWQVRRTAAESLRQLGPRAEAARPALLEAMNDQAFYVGLEARLALQAQGKAAIPDLLKLLREPASPRRDHAISAMVALAPQASAAQAQEMGTALASLARDARMDVRWSTLEALNALAEKFPDAAGGSAAPVAAVLASTTESLRLRLSALGVLHQLAKGGKLEGRPAAALAAAEHDPISHISTAANKLKSLREKSN